MESDVAADAPPDQDAERRDYIYNVARQFPDLSTGHRAELRRMYLTERATATGVVSRLLSEAGVKLPISDRAFEDWRLVTHCAALLCGTSKLQPHVASRHFGEALQDIGFSEARLLRLTSARGPLLRAQIIRAVRMLAQKDDRKQINLRTLFDLVSGHPEQAERARIKIAQTYYGAKARSEEDSIDD